MIEAIKGNSNGRTEVHAIDGFNSDIRRALEAETNRAAAQVRNHTQDFKKSNVLETGRAIWNFLKKKINYKADPHHTQSIKLPARFLSDGYGDCKSYTLFTAAIAQSLGIPYSIRYAGYDNSGIPSHVYTVLHSKNGDVIVDGVWHRFNDEKPYNFKQDTKMKVQTLSGVCTPGDQLAKMPDTLKEAKVIAIVKDLAKSNDTAKQDAAAHFIKHHQAGTLDCCEGKKAVAAVAVLKQQAPQADSPSPTISLVTGELITKPKAEILINESINGVGINGLWDNIKNGVKNTIQKIGHGSAKVILAAPRAAFLGLVALNVKGLARILDASIKADPNGFNSLWMQIGGDQGHGGVNKAIKSGLAKKQLFGIGEVVTAATAASAAVTAAPVTTKVLLWVKAIGPKLKQLGKAGSDAKALADGIKGGKELADELNKGGGASPEASAAKTEWEKNFWAKNKRLPTQAEWDSFVNGSGGGGSSNDPSAAKQAAAIAAQKKQEAQNLKKYLAEFTALVALATASPSPANFENVRKKWQAFPYSGYPTQKKWTDEQWVKVDRLRDDYNNAAYKAAIKAKQDAQYAKLSPAAKLAHDAASLFFAKGASATAQDFINFITVVSNVADPSYKYKKWLLDISQNGGNNTAWSNWVGPRYGWGSNAEIKEIFNLVASGKKVPQKTPPPVPNPSPGPNPGGGTIPTPGGGVLASINPLLIAAVAGGAYLLLKKK